MFVILLLKFPSSELCITHSTPQIQINHDVRPDSNLILHAAQAVTEEEGFDDLLEGVRDRIDEIESLHRTRELTVSHFLMMISVYFLFFYFIVQGFGEGRYDQTLH